MSQRLHSCDHCQRILLDSNALAGSVFNVEHLKLPHTLAEAQWARQDRCPLFTMLPDSLFTHCRPVIPPPVRVWMIKGVRRKKLLLRLCRLMGSWRPLGADFRSHSDTAESALQGKFSLYVDDHVCQESRLLLSVPADAPAAREYTARPLIAEPDFEEEISWIKEQLQTCLDEHHCANLSTDFAPRRLITLEALPRLRICQPVPGPDVQWCALSYCWGSSKFHITTTSNLDGRLKEGFDVSELPQTLRDAVRVCRQLGVKYLWIDSICIVQDSDEQRTEDLATMPDIFRLALITLSAARASSADQGFLQPRDLSVDVDPFTLRYRCKDGTDSHLVARPWLPNMDTDPIDLRAWTMQERMLANRLVQFTRTRLSWRCLAGTAYNSGPGARVLWRTRDSHISSSPRDFWSVVCDYTERKLTHRSDRLIAIAAMAKWFGENSPYYSGQLDAWGDYREVQESSDEAGIRYLAGMWDHDLSRTLTWRIPYGSAIERPAEYRAPSWSWASVDGPVEGFVGCLRYEPLLLYIISYNTVPAEPLLPYGNARSGSLVVQGCPREATWFYNRKIDGPDFHGIFGEIRIDGEEADEETSESEDADNEEHRAPACRQVGGRADAAEKEWSGDIQDPAASVRVLCLPVSRSDIIHGSCNVRGIMLQSASQESSAYSRLGFWMMEMVRMSDENADIERQKMFKIPRFDNLVELTIV